jgi:Ser/Thr protein kinase RdoA (MazF antagonist)
VGTTSDSWGPQTIARIHGDFDAINILVGPPASLTIIDFADSRNGFALEDVVRCWHAAWALSRLMPRIDTFASALLEGYRLAPSELESPLVRFLRCWNAVAFLLTATQVRSRFSLNTRRLLARLVNVNRTWLESLVSNPVLTLS